MYNLLEKNRIAWYMSSLYTLILYTVADFLLESSENLHSYLLFFLKKHVIICTALAPENS